MKRLAIIGLGAWGCRLVESVQGISSTVKFTTAVIRRPEAARANADKYGLAITTDLASVLGDPEIDGIVSCGPAHLHATHSLAGLEAGKPVLAVKPMALVAADANRLLEASRRTGTLLALGYNRCYFPNVMEMRRRLSHGALGTLVHAEGDFCVDRYRGIKAGSWKADPLHAPPGGLADHMLYLTIETLGHLTQAQAIAFEQHSDNALADVTAVMLRSKANQSALLTAIGVTPDYYRFQIFGTEGWIELRDDTQLTYQPRKGKPEVVTFERIDAERAELEGFADAIAGRVPFPVPAADAAHGVAALEAIATAARENRTVTIA